jgi:hypothetical protein
MRRLLVVCGCVGGLLAPALAEGAGGPIPAMQGGPGVSVPGGASRYVAVGVGKHTVVEQVQRSGGTVERTLTVAGSYGVPRVAYDNATTGLSADGSTLVLAAILNRFPIRRTGLLVIDPRSLRVVRRVTLPGYYTVDAIAPAGGRLYLIHYTRQDATRYEVRAYDLTLQRLLPAPVVDAREPREKMQGFPLTRATSAGGRFAYTLYQRPQGAPFLHVLDTVHGAAACIDLPSLDGKDLSTAQLTPPAGKRPLLARVAGAAPLAVDVPARRARPFTALPSSPHAATGRAEPGAGSHLFIWAIAVTALTAIAALARWRRRRRALGPRAMPA